MTEIEIQELASTYQCFDGNYSTDTHEYADCLSSCCNAPLARRVNSGTDPHGCVNCGTPTRRFNLTRYCAWPTQSTRDAWERHESAGFGVTATGDE